MSDDTEHSARFDSLRGDTPGRSIRFSGVEDVVHAGQPSEVPALLHRVAEAAQRGLHAAGYLSYEAAAGLADELRVHAPATGQPPLAAFVLFRDRVETVPQQSPSGSGWRLGPWEASSSKEHYHRVVGEIRERIAAGETYQVNHTLHLRARFEGSPHALYAELCRSQAAEFCAFLRFAGHTILSASPELFFRWDGSRLELRPMKGTRPRGRWKEEDDALAAALLRSAKDRAENLMIVDLLRSDAGRVAEWGSVRVTRLWELERYPTVHQLTSSIEARTREGVTLPDLFRALFPCGSVTGAPKVRTMEIIRRLEGGPRGVYTGAIGYVSGSQAVFSVAIRTLVLEHATMIAELGVGSGITWDSVASAEFDECLAKAAFVRPAPNFELLETMLAEDGEVFLLKEHLDRLQRSAEAWGFPMPAAELRDRLSRAAASTRSAGPRKIRLRLDLSGRITIEETRIDADPDPAPPLRVAIADGRVDSRDALLYHKTTRRQMYDERRATRPDCDDVLLVNERGELTEATFANLLVEHQGVLWTPPASAGLLPGTFRARLLRAGRIRERTIMPAELPNADAVYLINSVQRFRSATVVE